jgi:hypothetical protein
MYMSEMTHVMTAHRALILEPKPEQLQPRKRYEPRAGRLSATVEGSYADLLITLGNAAAARGRFIAPKYIRSRFVRYSRSQFSIGEGPHHA